jgi:hypothetical protein
MSRLIQLHIDGTSERGISVKLFSGLVLCAVYTAILSTCRRDNEWLLRLLSLVYHMHMLRTSEDIYIN